MQPEWDSCQCCNKYDELSDDDGPIRISRLYWWYYSFNRRRADKALDRWIEDRWVDEQVKEMKENLLAVELVDTVLVDGQRYVPKKEKELEDWSKANWAKIPEDKRLACLGVLQGFLPVEYIAELEQRVALGLAIMTISPRFHFGEGMQIRNMLRSVLPDEQLPPVKQEHLASAPEARNWDDFYIGALHALVAESAKPG